MPDTSKDFSARGRFIEELIHVRDRLQEIAYNERDTLTRTSHAMSAMSSYFVFLFVHEQEEQVKELYKDIGIFFDVCATERLEQTPESVERLRQLRDKAK